MNTYIAILLDRLNTGVPDFEKLRSRNYYKLGFRFCSLWIFLNSRSL